MIKKFTTLGIILACAVALSACSYGKTSISNDTTNQTQDQSQTGQSQSTAESAATVTFAGGSVSPTKVTVESGQAVTWENKGTSAVTVASNPHPTHTDNRELANGQSTLSLAPGASATVTLTKKGTWGFHDHLNLSTKGTVVVE